MDCDLHSSALAAYAVVMAESQAMAERESVARMVVVKQGVNQKSGDGVRANFATRVEVTATSIQVRPVFTILTSRDSPSEAPSFGDRRSQRLVTSMDTSSDKPRKRGDAY